MEDRKKPGFGRVGLAIALVAVPLLAMGLINKYMPGNMLLPKKTPSNEDFSLVQSIENEEHISAAGLSKAECEQRKKELKSVSSKLGIYNETTGLGSITCIPSHFMK